MADSPTDVLLLSSMYTGSTREVHEAPFYWWLPWGVGFFCSTLLRWGSKGPLATLRKGDSDLLRFIYNSYTDSLRIHDHPRLDLFLPLGRVGQRRRWTTNCGQQEARSAISSTIFFYIVTPGVLGAILHRYFTLYFMWFRNQVYWTNVSNYILK